MNCFLASGGKTLALDIARTDLSFHSGSLYLRNHWYSSIFTIHCVPHLQTTFSGRSKKLNANLRLINLFTIFYFASDTGIPENSAQLSFILPILNSLLYSSLVASSALLSYWSFNFILLTNSTAGASAYPCTDMTETGFIASAICLIDASL